MDRNKNNEAPQSLQVQQPLSERGRAASQTASEQALVMPSLNKTTYTALIVDDYVPSQEILGSFLSMQQQIGDIDYADNGELALNKAKSRTYDIIFLDAVMPGFDGYETCRRFRELPGYRDALIIMVTGLSSSLDEAKGVVAGSTAFVTKPIQQEPFKILIGRLLSLLEFKKRNNDKNPATGCSKVTK